MTVKRKKGDWNPIYTKPPNQRSGSTKDQIYHAWLERFSLADALALNATFRFKRRVLDATIKKWIWKWKEYHGV